MKLSQLIGSNNLKSLAGPFSVYTGANIINQMLPFILLPVMTRFLTPNDYGIWATFAAMTGIVNALVGMGIVNAVMRAYYNKKNESYDFPSYTTSALSVNAAMFILVAGLMFAARHFLSERFSVPSNWLMLIPVAAIGAAVYAVPSKLYVFKKKPLPYAGLLISNTAVELTLSIIFVVVIGLGWRGRVMGNVFNEALFMLIGLMILKKHGLLRFAVNKEYVKDAFFYGAPIVLNTLGITIMAATDKLFLTRMIGPSETGLYSVGYAVAAVILFINGAFSLAWQPFLYEKLSHATETTKKKLVLSTYAFFGLILITALIFILASPLVFRILIGNKYAGASRFIILLVLANTFQGMHLMVSGYITFSKKTYLFAANSVMLVAANILFNYVLIKAHGAIGAAEAVFFTYLLRFLSVWYLSNKAFPMPWFSFAGKGK